MLHRNDLLSALLSGCVAHGVRLHTDASVAELTDTGTATVAACADGREFTRRLRSAPTGSTRGSGNTSSTMSPSGPDSWPTGARSPWRRSSGTPICVTSLPGSAPACTCPVPAALRPDVQPGRRLRQRGSPARRPRRGRRRSSPPPSPGAPSTCGSRCQRQHRRPLADAGPAAHAGLGAGPGGAARRCGPIPCCSTSPRAPARPWRTQPCWPPELAGRAPAGPPVQRGTGPLRARVRAPRAARVQRTARTWGRSGTWAGWPELIRDELLLTRDVADHRHVSRLFGHSVFGPGTGGRNAGPDPCRRGHPHRSVRATESSGGGATTARGR